MARILGGSGRSKTLRELLTPEEPLGPSFTEAQLTASPEVFTRLYDEMNGAHKITKQDRPLYIIGRKGAGKTAFLVGGAFISGADVVLLQSEDVYSEVNKLRVRYAASNGRLVADSLVHVWEVLLLHAAMWSVARSKTLPNSRARQRLHSYMSSFGDPSNMVADQLMAQVTARLTQSLLEAPPQLSFREACWRIRTPRGTLETASKNFQEVMTDFGSERLFVVVDNLEDLHRHLDEFEEIITGLFRMSSRAHAIDDHERHLFRTRFAFPAELLPKLRSLTANPEKDFLNSIVVRWTARELIVLAGNRLRLFLDLYYPGRVKALGLPSKHDHRDADAAEATLRAVLPPGELMNGLGTSEDPVAYIMRHTQLLPRHLIQILNKIIAHRLDRTDLEDPRVEEQDVIVGVRQAERLIVDGILTTYSYEHPLLAEALGMAKNHVETVTSMSRLHEVFNEASIRRSGLDFYEFIDGCLAVGALGIVMESDRHRSSTERYVTGEFSYTFADNLRPVEDRDQLCVHPLFMYRLFDRRSMQKLRTRHIRPVYPYGSDPAEEAVET